jgi:DNA-binding NarL/FixJ family response regulator
VPAGKGAPGAVPAGAEILIASDARAVREEVKAVLGKDVTVREVTAGEQVMPAVQEQLPDLLVCDFQVGNMGGMAICLELRLEESGGRAGHVPVLLLLDRRPDVFLARRCDADGWLVKPLDPVRMRRAITALLQGGTFYDGSYRPAESAAR